MLPLDHLVCLHLQVQKLLCSFHRHWPVRSYPWGTAEALSSSHSDVPALKRLLIELSFDDIKVGLSSL